ncbi:PD-(D/E)XK nuclease family protein [Thalassospira sp.]|uniref:PDDEXK-like family protein n=1 Tax=Thalassospira sp. TaxID=1912094 RepID=UPI000C371707|nr:PD-(D/E)XK nuclease family protein [Thalassospira sp.]MBC06430.1 PD-(D/E)XK nuclease [Thalassospira sp.]|tara:strand:+ start:19014 stop:19730 length:717 start_codon:yes stop_codon:yes gene_type:complete
MNVETLTSNLPAFFQCLAECHFEVLTKPEKRTEPINETQLKGLFDRLTELALSDVFETVGSCNPWNLAGLGRDEVRNAAVLKWLLSPRGDHGLQAELLRNLLADIPDFPQEPSRYCRLAVEDCPDGLRDSRVDIRIDDPRNFFLIIEVKIGASEQSDQLRRYCEIAAACARDGRPWKVVYLTCRGSAPTTAGEFIDDVVPISWSRISEHLRMIVRMRKGGHEISNFLANSFAKHISSF